MKAKAKFCHAGGTVCIEAEQQLAESLDPARSDVEIVHLGYAKGRLAEAKTEGVKAVPALVLGDTPFHINFRASLEGLK